MYNEDRKMRFIIEMKRNVGFGKSIFNATSPFEFENSKDLCELPIEILQYIVNTKMGARTRTMDNTISFLKTYVLWCQHEGYNTVDDVYQIRVELDEKIKRLMVGSPLHLELLLDKIFDPVQSETVDCLYRCYLWMGFAGLEESDAIEVTTDEIDFNALTIEHGGRSYEFYKEAIPAFRMACDATQFKYINPRYTDDKQNSYRNRFAGRYLLRGIRSEQIQLTTIHSTIRKKMKNIGLDLSYSKIQLSGLFYQVYEMERIGMPVNFNDYIVQQVERTEHTYHRNYTRNKLVNTIKRDLINDYECWKAVFTK